jgi:hypothetical protein
MNIWLAAAVPLSHRFHALLPRNFSDGTGHDYGLSRRQRRSLMANRVHPECRGRRHRWDRDTPQGFQGTVRGAPISLTVALKRMTKARTETAV